MEGSSKDNHHPIDISKAVAFLMDYPLVWAKHSGITLIEHFINTNQILQKWNVSEQVAYAGLFHSIYGTTTGATRIIPSKMRSTVADLIGSYAEHLVWLYSTTDLKTVIDTSESSYDTTNLVWLHLANMKDQLSRSPDSDIRETVIFSKALNITGLNRIEF